MLGNCYIMVRDGSQIHLILLLEMILEGWRKPDNLKETHMDMDLYKHLWPKARTAKY